MTRYRVNLVVEVELAAANADEAADVASRRIQTTLDARQKSLSAVVCADYGDVREVAPEDDETPEDGGQ